MPSRFLRVAIFAFVTACTSLAHAADRPGLLESIGSLFKPADSPPAGEEKPAPAATRNLSAVIPAGERRVALVIGNNAYRHVTRLDNAVPDAKAMAREFRALGFDVIERTDIDQRGMKAAVREFVQKVANGGIGAFFFAGHGVQQGGNNYLLPIDISKLTDSAALSDEAIELNGEIMGRIGEVGAKFSLLVIDACRDNPFPKVSGRTVGGTRGLTAATNAPEGMIVVYSAGVGQQALDRLDDGDRDPNGLFTREFVREIRKPGLEVAEVVRNVRKRVKDQAAKVKHDQTPAIYIQADSFYLIPNAGSVTIQTPEASAEDSFWAALNPAQPCEYQTYIDQYPQGKYVALAKRRLAECTPKATADKPTATEPPKVAVPSAPTFAPAVPAVQAASPDPETQFWSEVKASGAREYFDAYLRQYPKGKYAALARIELKKLDDKDRAERAKQEADRKAELARLEADKKAAAEQEKVQKARDEAGRKAAEAKTQREAQQAEQDAWERAKAAGTVAAYSAYLGSHPNGRYAALAQAARQKAQREEADREKQETARLEREARESESQRLAAERNAAERARQEAARLAKEAAEMRPGKVFKDCADCPEMVMIPAGSFEMGSNSGDSDEKPVHRVTLKGFALGRTEVTQGQWRAVMGNNPSRFSSCGDDCPVEQVSWDDAKTFIQRLNAKAGKSYRLPSEAEWEYACRAGGTHTYCGSENIDSVAWYSSNSSSKTHSVTGKQAIAWGLHDMSGNVWEWVEDCWNGSYNGAPSDGSAWTSGDCSLRVLRGGSWDNDPQVARAADRYRFTAGNRVVNGGFRLARTLF